jgi:hypothetical protein
MPPELPGADQHQKLAIWWALYSGEPVGADPEPRWGLDTIFLWRYRTHRCRSVRSHSQWWVQEKQRALQEIFSLGPIHPSASNGRLESLCSRSAPMKVNFSGQIGKLTSLPSRSDLRQE